MTIWRPFRDDYLEAKIEDYKYGVITAEEFCKAMEDLGKYPLLLVDRNLDRITNCMIPEICKSYMEADASDKDRDLKFWIGLKDCEYLMHFGWTFTEEREEYYRTGRDRRAGDGAAGQGRDGRRRLVGILPYLLGGEEESP